MARTLAARDTATFEHARRVRRYARALASRVGIVDEEELRTLETAALFHDVGKLAIPDHVLSKAGPLTPEEYEQVKRHAAIGADLLTGLAFPGPLALLVRHHHENWDGTGYPDRLRREDIPAGARALSIADCYDALTSDRPYRRALSHATAMAMMTDRCGSMFDPMMIEAFVSIAESLQPAALVSAHTVSSVRAGISSPLESGVR
ncbi:MAG TPA: HD domain-containing phosphohydrolase [Vicinamibacterales bacterium]|nr:HD domain-containing phosphohydrolase [Vicinamibacterales bacterium]